MALIQNLYTGIRSEIVPRSKTDIQEKQVTFDQLLQISCKLSQSIFTRSILKIMEESIAPFINNLIYSTTMDLLHLLPMTADKFARMTTPDIIRYYGYPCEVHQVVTEDGYILTLHRIPYGREAPKLKKRQPLLLQHGFVCSSSIWVLRGFNHGLGFLLADYGFDVWLGNFRGNKYSNAHVTINPLSHKFWDFTLTDIGLYDVPAMIDYVLQVSKCKKLVHVGHSMGVMTFLILCSVKPEYNSKVITHISVAGVVYLANMSGSILRYVVDNLPSKFSILGRMTGWHELFRSSAVLAKIGSTFFGEGKVLMKPWKKFLFNLCGSNEKQYEPDVAATALGHYPQSTSLKLVNHFAQIRISDCFGFYDYGEKENLKRYNSSKPPLFDLKKVTVPIHLIWSKNDSLTNEVDVQRIRSELPNVVSATHVPDPSWSHHDFILGKDAPEVVYSIVLDIAQSYSHKM